MLSILTKHLTRLCNDEDGVTLVEYGIALGMAVAVGTPVLIALATAIGTSLGKAQALMP